MCCSIAHDSDDPEETNSNIFKRKGWKEGWREKG
jgi:hypothetical protein